MGAPAVIATAAVAGGMYSAYQQKKAGTVQAKELTRVGDYNAQIYGQQANMILEQKKLHEYQSNRAIGRAQGSIVARTAGAGFNFGGSSMAIAIDNETQMLLDQAVGNYNYDVQYNQALSAAKESRYSSGQQARLARSNANTNAFSTILNSGTSAYTTYKIGKL